MKTCVLGFRRVKVATLPTVCKAFAIGSYVSNGQIRLGVIKKGVIVDIEMAHVVENVVKQGYLKKGNTGSNRISGFFRRNDTNKWFVFTIRQGVPFLEYYDNDIDVFSQPPINSFNLSGCQNVKSMGNSNPPSFCIVCPDRVIELIASSRSQMIEWVNEVEASLIRLGILQQDIADHVYTACPAVIQKPRPNKDNADVSLDFITTTHTTTKTTEEKRSSDTVLMMATELRQNVSPKTSPLTMRSHSWQSSSSSAAPSSPSRPVDCQPPPLPIRAPHQLLRQGCKKTADSPPSSDLTSVLTPNGSSNDSDFVSPEIIAQLREVSKMRRSEERHDLAKDARTHSIHGSQNESSSNRNSLEGQTSSSRHSKCSKTGSTTSADDESVASPFTCSFDNDSIFTCHSFDNDSTFTCHSLERPVSIEQNDYSALPCHDGSSDFMTVAAAGNEADKGESLSSSKPIPMPRKGLSKRLSGGSPSGSSNNSFTLSSSLPEKSTPTDHSTPVINGEAFLEDIDDDYPILIQSLSKLDNLDNKSKSLSLNASDRYLSDKLHDSKSSKDENENFCIPMYDDFPPPEEMAPPVPPVPPLPPRKDSLPLKKNGNVSEVKMSHFEMKTTSSSSSTVTSMSSVKHANILDDLLGAPPLPMPRKKGSTSQEFYRKSHPPSAFTMNGFHEMPPVLPRRPQPDSIHSSSTSDIKPPHLPSRTSQSFIIKRPQIKEFCSLETTAVKSLDDSRETKSCDASSLNSRTGLSRKMLLDRSHTLHTVVSLKQTQADILQTEISSPSLTVQLTQKSCHGLALVDWEGSPCLVGWNQKDFPSLHGKLHIGDILLSVNNVEVKSVEMAQKLLKQPNPSKVDVVLKRMPFAKVIAIRKNSEGQNLGIKREGGTGEIVYIDPNGLAAQHGLLQHAVCTTGTGRCHWFLTEINSRPLNLFFKDDEIEHRLSAVGREITIVVQPYDFILQNTRPVYLILLYSDDLITLTYSFHLSFHTYYIGLITRNKNFHWKYTRIIL
ncbi:hypothetical protein Btru_017193 [Bulinus truncatus]|nr:hypothetical protein Btru_017193 [Bulinus truncatus]